VAISLPLPNFLLLHLKVSSLQLTLGQGNQGLESS